MTSLPEFQQLVESHRAAGHDRLVVPVVRRRSADMLTPVSAFLLLREGHERAFLLESVEGGEKLARYSFLGRDPYRIIRADADGVTSRESDGARVPLEGNIFEVLSRQMAAFTEIPHPDLPRFSCGAVGYLAYDTVRSLEHLPRVPTDSLGLPDGEWSFFDTLVAFDHVKHQLVLMSSAFVTDSTDLAQAYTVCVSRIDAVEKDLGAPLVKRPEPVRLKGRITSNFDRADFEASVEKAREYIREGDIFQVVLSQRFEIPFSGDPFNLYRALRQVNPSPYLYFIDSPDFAIVGSSPEVLVRVRDRTAEVLPIAGTRPRGTNPEQDQQLESELLDDAKERAEHLMLVDLGRNDIARISRFGTVHVDRFAYVERYSHVMHIVSSVSGEVAPEHDSLSVLSACFPAGTVSGAPKVRAMEIIDELEPTKREVYAGAVGYVNFSGDLDTCIAIRTMVVRNGVAYVQAGAGIVADSDPGREFEETENKARALHQAMQVAARELL